MKKLIYSLVVLVFVTMGFASSFGQQNKQNESNVTYKIYTHTVVGSNDSSGKTNLSSNLSKAFENVRGNFRYTNYKLLSTQFQLIKAKGSIEYKSVLRDFESANDSEMPIFAEWNYRSFGENKVEGKNKGSFGFFQFVLRFPVKFPEIKKEGEPTNNVVYEKLGLTTRNIEFMVGEPTVFASFPIEYSNQTLFFVVHIEKAK